MKIDSSTELFCIFGNPVRHSLSPVMQNAALDALGLNAVYLAFQPESIADAISSFRSLGISGASITIPFKTDVIPLIDHVDPLAQLIGSVNTLRNDGGIIHGYNTDGPGALKSLHEKGITVGGSRCLILGSGGAARAIGFTLASEGASVYISGIDIPVVDSLVHDISAIGRAESFSMDRHIPSDIRDMDILINCTPVGMEPAVTSTPIPAECLHDGLVVFDIVYAPLETRLLREAAGRGCVTVNGLSMLLHQGVKQFEIWTGLEAPHDVMKRVLEREVHWE